MDLGSIFTGGGIALGLLTLVQVSPIKVNPWSSVGKLICKGFKALGKSFNGDIVQQLELMQKDILDLKERDRVQDALREEYAALNARRRIIQFADEIRRKVRHSEEHFNDVFIDIKNYNDYCHEHPNFENGKAVASIAIIEDTYKKCVAEDDFL